MAQDGETGPKPDPGTAELMMNVRSRPRIRNMGGKPALKALRWFLSDTPEKMPADCKKVVKINGFIPPLIVVDHDGNPVRRRDALFEALYRKALDHSAKDQVRAIELLLAYTMGKPTTVLELSGPGGGPLEMSDRDPAEMTSEARIARIFELQGKMDALTARMPAALKTDAKPTDGG